MGWKITGADQSVIASRYRRFAFDKEESGAISVAARQQLLRAMWLEKWKRGTYGAIIERRTSVKTVSLGSLAFDRAAKDGLRGGCMPVHILSFIRILSCIKDPGPRRETVTKTRPRGPVSPSNRPIAARCTLFAPCPRSSVKLSIFMVACPVFLLDNFYEDRATI